jgi:trimeric autotransporter adhesin
MRTRHRSTPPILQYSPLVVAVALALASHGAAAQTVPAGCVGAPGPTTCTVTNNTDGTLPTPPGSLREAIEYLNGYHLGPFESTVPNCTGSDAIKFAAPFTIALSSPLPALDCDGLKIGTTRSIPVKIDGTIPYGGCGLEGSRYAKVTGLEISGFMGGYALCGNLDIVDNKLHDNQNGIYGSYDDRVIQGNLIASNYTGIYLSSAYGGSITGNTIQDNQYGISYSSSGRPIVSNTITGNMTGIDMCSSTATITGNTVSGMGSESTAIDLCFSDITLTNNTINDADYGVYAYYTRIDASGNKIGTDEAGNSARGNLWGMYLDFARGSIGGNVISGNSYEGIAVNDTNGALTISGNNIGTNLGGTAAIPNGDGIAVQCAANGVGISNNTISGNNGSGITLWGAKGTEFGVAGGGSVAVTGNRIGVKGDGVSALPNNSYGMYLGYSTCNDIGQSTSGVLISGNTIASNLQDGVGLSSADLNNFNGNTIRANMGRGISFFFSSGVGNEMVENLIYDNGGKAIDLGYSDGALPNDPGDFDSGANNRQNYPANITAQRHPGTGTTSVNFTLDAVPFRAYRIDVYRNTSSAPGGREWLGNTYMDPVNGTKTFTVENLTADNFSLTATDVTTHDTSEYSPVTVVDATPAATVTPMSINFGNVAVNDSSLQRNITVRSTGSAPYVINGIGESCYGGGICYGGPFVCSTSCEEGTSYSNGSTCDITARFAPTGTGHYTATIRICDNTDFSPRDILLSGDGVVPPPVSITPSAFDFGSVLVGRQSAAQSFTIANPGSSAVAIGAVTATVDFLVTSSTCGGSIQPGESCNADVVFTPGQQGPLYGFLEVQSGAARDPLRAGKGRMKTASTASAALQGLGIAEAQLVLPTNIDMGSYVLGTTPLQRTVVLTNNGNTGLQFSTISLGAPFTLANGCPSILPPGQSCSLVIGFSTATLGTFSGTLSVVTNSATGSGAVPVTARTVAVPAPELRLSVTSMGFGDRLFNTTSPTQRVTITNIGTSLATFAAIETSNLDFLVAGTTCGATLAPAATCFADVAMRPVGFGPRTGQLVVSSNGAGSPQVVNLVGSGCRPYMGSLNRTGAQNGCAP